MQLGQQSQGSQEPTNFSPRPSFPFFYHAIIGGNFTGKNFMKRETSVTLTLIFFLLFLAGCTFNPFTTNNRTTGSATGALVGAGAGAGGVALLGGSKPLMALAGVGGGAIGYYVTTLRYDSGGIIQSGGQVYQVGEFVGIYIPTDKLFEPNTNDFLPQAGPILDSTAQVLKRYPNNNIIISGNTSGFYRSRWELKLSEKRAQKVASYLWNAGINQFKNQSIEMRKLNYVGYGDYLPISSDYTNEGIRQNSRIQITSYPSNQVLGLDKRKTAVYNVGDFNNDKEIEEAPPSRGCGLKGEC
jgi:outer membrane protein OmpA-like peptidoglycan-associated protein